MGPCGVLAHSWLVRVPPAGQQAWSRTKRDRNTPDQCFPSVSPRKPGPGNVGVFHSVCLQKRSLIFPVPQEGEKDPGVRRSVLWTPGWEPSSLGARPRKASPPLWGPAGGRKEVMQDRISPSQGLQSSWLQSPDKQAILLLTWLGGCKIPPIQLDFKRPFFQQGCEGKVAEPWTFGGGCLTAGTPGLAQSYTEELGGTGVSHLSSLFCLLGLLHLCPSLPAGLDSHPPWERHRPSGLPHLLHPILRTGARSPRKAGQRPHSSVRGSSQTRTTGAPEDSAGPGREGEREPI